MFVRGKSCSDRISQVYWRCIPNSICPPASMGLGLSFLMSFQQPCPPPSECGPCADCEQQSRTLQDQSIDRFVYEKEITDETAKDMATGYVNSINKDLQHLRDGCSSYGNTILNRWKNKSREKRQASLLQVEPKIYPHSWAHPRMSYEIPKSAGGTRRPHSMVTSVSKCRVSQQG